MRVRACRQRRPVRRPLTHSSTNTRARADVFVSRALALALLSGHLLTLAFFAHARWCAPDGGLPAVVAAIVRFATTGERPAPPATPPAAAKRAAPAAVADAAPLRPGLRARRKKTDDEGAAGAGLVAAAPVADVAAGGDDDVPPPPAADSGGPYRDG